MTRHISTNAVTANEIAANTIVADNVSTNAIIARHISASAVTAEKISANAVTAIKISAGAVTADKIATNAVTTNKLNAEAVTAAKIAANTITAAKIAANTITANEIAVDTITANRIATNAIVSRHITTGSIVADKLASGSVTTVKLAAGAVTADRIAARAITAEHLTANAIQVGFNAMGSTLQLSATALTFNTAGTRAGMLTSTGLQYWWGDREIGQLHHSSQSSNVNRRGLGIGLANTGDYIAFGFRATSSASIYTNSMLLDPFGRWSGTNGQSQSGIHMLQRLMVRQMATRGYTANRNFEVQVRVIGGVQCTYIGEANGSNGIAFSNNRMFVCSRGQSYDWHTWVVN